MPIKDAAKLIGVSHQYAWSMVKQGRIKATKFGPMWIADKASVMQFKAQRDAAA